MQLSDTRRTEKAVSQIRPGNRDICLVFACSLSLLLLIVFQPWLGFLAPLRLLLGIVYVLGIPGYCLSVALFPDREDLDLIERIGLSIGLSIALAPLLALILDQLSWGLHLWPILASEYALTAVFVVVGLWRRSRLAVDRAYAPELSWRPRTWWQEISPIEKQTYKYMFAALIAAGLSVAWVVFWPSPAEFTTEFYMLGEDGLAEKFPREAIVGQELSVVLGTTNRERSDLTYRIEVWVKDIWNPDQRELVATNGPFVVARGDNRERSVAWKMSQAGQDQEVQFLLYKGDDPTPYRSLRLVMDVKDESDSGP